MAHEIFSLKFLLRGFAASLVGLSIYVIPANAEPAIKVLMNEAKIVRLARDADTVIVGNPEIADASVQDAKTIVLTGKGFGITNLVILDKDGAPIVDNQVFVTRSTDKTLRVYRRANVQTLSCSPYCEGAYRSPAEQQSDQAIASGSQ